MRDIRALRSSDAPPSEPVSVSARASGKTENRGGCESRKRNAIREEVGGRDRVRTCDPLLAKQVLSQLSYTPTAGTATDVKAFAAVRKLRKLTFCPLLCQNCVKTPVARPLLCQNS